MGGDGVGDGCGNASVLATGGEDGRLLLWNTRTWELVRECSDGDSREQKGVGVCAFLPPILK